jgi:hypothetical protein
VTLVAVDGRDPHRLIPRELRCEFERTLKGEGCSEKGYVRLEDLWLCERHAYRLWLEERVAYWRAMLAHAELWSGKARRRGRDDVVGRLGKLQARSAAALGCILEDLEESVEQGDHTCGYAYVSRDSGYPLRLGGVRKRQQQYQGRHSPVATASRSVAGGARRTRL